MVAEGDEEEIIHEILEGVKEKLTTEEVNKLLLATDHKGRTVLHWQQRATQKR